MTGRLSPPPETPGTTVITRRERLSFSDDDLLRMIEVYATTWRRLGAPGGAPRNLVRYAVQLLAQHQGDQVAARVCSEALRSRARPL